MNHTYAEEQARLKSDILQVQRAKDFYTLPSPPSRPPCDDNEPLVCPLCGGLCRWLEYVTGGAMDGETGYASGEMACAACIAGMERRRSHAD